ncbi:hypothetical protein ASG52_08400 [Methylobacterium sp. Leaf456]|nr:hypothetical protein ASG52_08400 [Methylobacterium sp. Leaf456]
MRRPVGQAQRRALQAVEEAEGDADAGALGEGADAIVRVGAGLVAAMRIARDTGPPGATRRGDVGLWGGISVLADGAGPREDR